MSTASTRAGSTTTGTGAASLRSSFAPATSSTSSSRWRASARSSRPRTSRTWCGTSRRSTTSAGPIFVEGASPGRHARGRDPRAQPRAVGLGDDHPRARPPGRGLSRAVPQDLRPPGPIGRDRGSGRRGCRSAVPRDDGGAHRRARPLRALPAAPRRRQRRLPPPDRRIDALVAGLVRGGALLVRRSARGAGRRRGLRDRDRVRDGGDAPLQPGRSGDRRARVPRAAHRRRSGALPRDDGDRSRSDGGRASRGPEHDRAGSSTSTG